MGIIVPQNSIIFARNQERIHVDDIVLPQIDILSFVVHDRILIFAQAVECFVVGRFEKLPDVKSFFSQHFSRCDNFAAASFFLKKRPAVCVVECNRPVLRVYAHCHFGCRDLYPIVFFDDGPAYRLPAGFIDHQTCARRKGFICRRQHADNIVGAYLNFHPLRICLFLLVDFEKNAVGLFFISKRILDVEKNKGGNDQAGQAMFQLHGTSFQ